MSLDHLFNDALIAVFTYPGAAIMLSGTLLSGCIAVLFTTWSSRVRPLKLALLKRVTEVGGCISGDTPERLRASFARNMGAVHGAMSARDKGSYVLQRAWLDYEQSFVDLEPDEIASSTRADVFFEGAGDPGRAMEWWANIFVALGLMFTFLGIVAALSQATNTIGQGKDSAAMQGALAALLGIAAAKFWTSIAGVGSSLILRFYGRSWRQSLERLEDELCELLDAGVRHISPQALALRQLKELQQLNAALGRVAPPPSEAAARPALVGAGAS